MPITTYCFFKKTPANEQTLIANSFIYQNYLIVSANSKNNMEIFSEILDNSLKKNNQRVLRNDHYHVYTEKILISKANLIKKYKTFTDSHGNVYTLELDTNKTFSAEKFLAEHEHDNEFKLLIGYHDVQSNKKSDKNNKTSAKAGKLSNKVPESFRLPPIIPSPLHQSSMPTLDILFKGLQDQLNDPEKNIYLTSYEYFRSKMHTLVRYKDKMLPLNIETINEYLDDNYLSPEKKPSNELTEDQLHELILRGDALVKSVSSSSDFLVNQLLDPQNVRPITGSVSSKEDRSRRFDVQSWLWTVRKEKPVSNTKDTIYTKKTSTSLIKKDGKMSFYEAKKEKEDDIRVLFIFNEPQCFLTKLIGKQNILSNTRFWIGGNQLSISPNSININYVPNTQTGNLQLVQLNRNLFCSSVDELRLFMDEFTKHNPDKIMPHNEVLACLTKNAFVGLSCLEQTVYARIKLLNVRNELALKFKKNLPIVIIEKDNTAQICQANNIIKKYDEEYQARDFLLAVEEQKNLAELRKLTWFSHLPENGTINNRDIFYSYLKHNMLAHAFATAILWKDINQDEILGLFDNAKQFLIENPTKEYIVLSFVNSHKRIIFGDKQSFKHVAWLINYNLSIEHLPEPMTFIDNDKDFDGTFNSLSLVNRIKWNMFIADALHKNNQNQSSLKFYNANKILLETESDLSTDNFILLVSSGFRMADLQNELSSEKEVIEIFEMLQALLVKYVNIHNVDINKQIYYWYLAAFIEMPNAILQDKPFTELEIVQRHLTIISENMNFIDNQISPEINNDKSIYQSLLLKYYYMMVIVSNYKNNSLDEFKKILDLYTDIIVAKNIEQKLFCFNLGLFYEIKQINIGFTQECYTRFIKQCLLSNNYDNFEQVLIAFNFKIKYHESKSETQELIETLEQFCQYQSKYHLDKNKLVEIKKIELYKKMNDSNKSIYSEALHKLADCYYQINKQEDSIKTILLAMKSITNFSNVNYLNNFIEIVKNYKDKQVDSKLIDAFISSCFTLLETLDYQSLLDEHVPTICSLFKFLSDCFLEYSIYSKFFQFAIRCLSTDCEEKNIPTIKEYNQFKQTICFEQNELANYFENFANMITALKKISPNYNLFIQSLPITTASIQLVNKSFENDSNNNSIEPKLSLSSNSIFALPPSKRKISDDVFMGNHAKKAKKM